MFRTIATKAVKLCSRAPSGACLTHTRCIHNVKLAELHKILHPTTETPLQLHGIKLHPEAHNQVTLNPDNLTIDQKAHVNSQPKMAVTESIWPEVGPLFEEAKEKLQGKAESVASEAASSAKGLKEDVMEAAKELNGSAEEVGSL